MENMKGNEIDLGLLLGNANKGVDSCSDRGVGANANTRSRLDTVVVHRPLSELVWSQQNTLSIKCAGQTVKCVHFIEMENRNKGKEKECVSSCKSIPVDNMAGTSEGPKNQTTADLLPLLVKEPEVVQQTNAENIGDDDTDIDIGLPLRMQNLVNEQEGRPFLEKIEETTENDAVVKNNAAIVEREDEGESMESCNSVSKKNNNKRWRFEQQWIIGSKRIKKQSQECCDVVKVKQQDSSFMNWISNMVKGVKPYQEDQGHPAIADDDDDFGDEKSFNVNRRSLGFQSVFQSLYSQDTKRLKTETKMENSNSKEIILFNDKTTDDNSLNRKAFGNLWITRLSPKHKDSSITPVATHSEITCFICGKTGHESRDCLRTNENTTSVLSRKKVSSNFNEIPPKQITSTSEYNMLNEEKKILSAPKGMFDTVRRLRLSRTDILKWMNSHLEIAKLDGYFIRLRLAKWKEGVGAAGYYVACITDENPSKGSKKPIRVNIGGVQWLVECRYISNCDFHEDELIAWWRTMLTSGRGLTEEDLTSKLEERKKLGF